MNKSSLLFCLIHISLGAFAQFDTTRNYIAPEFVGGNQEYIKYLNKYVRYPAAEREKHSEGDVYAILTIDHDGNIYDVKVTGDNEAFNKEAKRVLLLMPPWTAAKLDGNKIDTIVKRKILFSLEKSRMNKKTTIADSTTYECLNYRVPVDLNDKEAIAKMNEELTARNAARALYVQGVTQLKNNNPDSALILFNQAESHGFRNADLYYNRGVACMRTGDKESACANLLEAARRGDEESLKLYIKICK